MGKFSLDNLSYSDLVYAVANYVIDDKEEEDYRDNPSDIHIYKLAMELRVRTRDLAHSFGDTDWEQLYIEANNEGGSI